MYYNMNRRPLIFIFKCFVTFITSNKFKKKCLFMARGYQFDKTFYIQNVYSSIRTFK